MQISSASATTPAAPVTSAGNSGSGSASSLSTPAPTEQMFLQLLVAQLQHQDPTSPQDPTQFVSQLADFTQVEQTLAIRQDADSIVSTLNSSASAAQAAASSGPLPGTTPPASTTPTSTNPTSSN